MAQKHLKELLCEDQEPFYLKDYIADRRCQLKKQAPITKLQVKKSKSMSKTASILCKNACFFSLQNSPDFRKSPKLFDFPASPVPNKSPTRVYLHVPAKTASLLLEAAIRIQKQKSKPKTTQIKNSSLGLFGSMLKRLTLRNRTQKLKNSDEKADDEIKGEISLVNVEDEKVANISSSCSSSSSRSCNGRLSSLDLESSSSGRSFEDNEEDDDDGFEFTNILRENNYNEDYYSPLCLSPLSPFHFALPRSPSPEHRSPVRCRFEDNVNVKYEEHESLAKFQEEEDEEDKEQNSPVSVLDPPFEDDYDGHEEDNFDIECSYAFVHRTQKELLQKLHRFDKLAELDPIELEKRMIEAEEEYTLEQTEEIEDYDHVSFTFHEQAQARELMQQVIRQSGYQDVKKPGIKRLISDLIVEEDSKENTSDEQVIKRVCKRLESWKEVESNTIDMMVEMDLRTEFCNWKKSQKEIQEVAMGVEVAIFAVLVDELLEEFA